ncbi:MAG: GNAT family N-acetyltransferase [Candidatus Bathyarchaeia archaeon]
MSVEDFAFAVRLTDTMNWNLVEDDFEFMMELEPDGCFVALDDSERIGLATTISFGKVGWLGNVIVSENHRGRGAGSLLVRHSIKYLTNKHVETVGLYAYNDRVPFYRRLGFEYDSGFVVLKGKGFSSPAGAHLREAGKEDIQEVIDHDHFCFGALRRKLLEPILLDTDNLCYISMEDRRMSGFVVAKVYEGMAEVGPLVCRRGRSDIATGLLKTTLNRLEGLEVSMCVPEKESAILDTLMGFGFSEDFRVARMFYGHPVIKDCIYVAESLERG